MIQSSEQNKCFVLSWRWKKQAPPKRRFSYTRLRSLHYASSQNANFMEQISSLKAASSQLVQKFPENSLPCTQQPVTCPQSEPDPLHAPHFISLRSILILSSHLRLGIRSGLLPLGAQLKLCIHFSSPPYVLHVSYIPSSFVSSPEQCLVRHSDHESPHYVNSSSPPLPEGDYIMRRFMICTAHQIR